MNERLVDSSYFSAKRLVRCKMTHSYSFVLQYEELRKIIRNNRYVKEFPVNFLVDEFISPLIVIKLKFLINDFFDREQVLTYAKSYVSVFWEQVKAG